MLNQQPFIQEVLMKNTYKIMKKHNPNPSCKPSNESKHHLPKNSPSKRLRLTPREDKPRTKAKK